jgi:hypothetical protein
LFVPEDIDTFIEDSDLKERMLVTFLLNAVGAEVEIVTDLAFVTESNDGVNSAAITVVVMFSFKVHEIIEYTLFGKYIVDYIFD